ncbi:MAG: pyruvate formate-lyase activating enzyme [uncultured bacterium]|nr:MAG: pyruvate formate-lyase activating enzyme [uncultured bacterium]
MKIAAIQPLSLSDFPGCCAAIIFTAGCNLRCHYCHNKNLWDENYQQMNEQEAFDFLHSKSKKIDGVVITGGEPTIHPGLVLFIKKIKNLGYKIKLNTNGTNPSCIKELIKQGLLDYIAMDVKAPFAIYDKLCGTTTFPDDIKTSIELISSSKIAHEFRTTFAKKWLTEADIEVIRDMIPSASNHIVQNESSA